MLLFGGGGHRHYCHKLSYGKTTMVWLSDGEKILKISLFILTEYTSVVDGRTDTAEQHRPCLCIASCCNKMQRQCHPLVNYSISLHLPVLRKVKTDPKSHPDQHQNLITSRVSPLAHAYSTMFGLHPLPCSWVILLTDRMNDRTRQAEWTIMLLCQPSHSNKV